MNLFSSDEVRANWKGVGRPRDLYDATSRVCH